MQTLVELCAGSAAVSLRWLHPKAKPPIAYQGGKRAYADAILLAMGLRPGGGQRAGRVVLVEAGPWGEAWAHWAAGGIPDTVERLRAWASEDPRALWTRLKDAPVPPERGDRVATWAVLLNWTLRRMPVSIIGAGWAIPACFNAGDAYGPQSGLDKFAATDIPVVINNLQAIAAVPWSRVQVLPHDCIEVEAIPGAHVYIDPPYENTTGYGCTLSRADVVEVAQRWRAAGCTVAISEQEPLAIPGWHHHELGKPIGNRRTFARVKTEWLTLSHPPIGVLPFPTRAAL